MEVSKIGLGDVLLDRYELVGRLGAGAQGRVFLARDRTTDSRVALKVCPPESLDEHGWARARQERAALSAVRSPHVVPLLDAQQDDDAGVFCLVEEVAPGVPLATLLQGDSPLGHPEILEILAQVARGLEALHAAGFVMRDLKPDQVVVETTDDRLHVTLIDLGLARALGEGTDLTEPGVVAGTPGFTAPELATGDPATPQCDVYSLGGLAYQMFSGEPPFGPARSEAVLAMQVADALVPLSFLRPVSQEVSAGVNECLAAALSADPSRRPRSPADLVSALGAILAPDAARPPEGHGAVPFWPETSWSALVAYALLAAGLLMPLLRLLDTHILADDIFIEPGTSDAYNSLWSYWWVTKALATGRSLLDCGWVLPPSGANLVFHTTSLLPAVITYPVARMFGTVTGYNVMVLAMLVLAAWVYFLFLTRTFRVAWWPALFGGALFGLGPYFLFKAHAHPNLIGAAFWGGALAALLHAYLHRTWSVRQGVLLALALWATFWTSFVEFFMVASMSAAVVVAFELRPSTRRRFSVGDRLRFYLPSLAGLPSLLVFLAAPETGIIERPLFDMFGVGEFFSFPRLSGLAVLATSRSSEYWGIYLPWSALVPGVVGFYSAWRDCRVRAATLALLALTALLLCADPFNLPSLLLRLLPMAGGFQVFARFFPFFLFFLLIFAALGFQRLISWRLPLGHLAAGFLVVLAVMETYPVHLQPSAVKSLPREVRHELAEDAFVMVVPQAELRNVHDTYQVALDRPCVHLSYLARGTIELLEHRISTYPAVYGGKRPRLDARFPDEAARLGIRYLLFEEPSQAAALPFPTRTVWTGTRETVVEMVR